MRSKDPQGHMATVRRLDFMLRATGSLGKGFG